MSQIGTPPHNTEILLEYNKDKPKSENKELTTIEVLEDFEPAKLKRRLNTTEV